MVAVEAETQGITVGEDTVAGLMCADDFAGVPETSGGFQKQIEKTLEYTEKLRVTANVKKRAVVVVVVCNEGKANPATFKWKWGEDEQPTADQYTCLGVEISKHCLLLGCTHSKRIGKGKRPVGKMDAILTDSRLETRIKLRNLMDVIVPKLEYAEVSEGKAKLAKQLETVQMTAAIGVLGRSSSTRNVVLKSITGNAPTHLKKNSDAIR